MSQATFSVRMDKDLKLQFENLCNNFGMNMTTAINVFAKAVVRERKIPFEIIESKPEVTREKAQEVFESMRSKSIKNGLSKMSLDEINKEISKARLGK